MVNKKNFFQILENSMILLGFSGFLRFSELASLQKAVGTITATNAGISDRLFKQHGRWKSDQTKNGYILDNLNSLLSVSKSFCLP